MTVGALNKAIIRNDPRRSCQEKIKPFVCSCFPDIVECLSYTSCPTLLSPLPQHLPSLSHGCHRAYAFFPQPSVSIFPGLTWYNELLKTIYGQSEVF